MRKGYLLIDYGRDNNDYQAFLTREAAQSRFIEMAREYGEAIDDPEILANDQDDMEELAAGGIYSPKGQLILEITPCTVYAGEPETKQIKFDWSDIQRSFEDFLDGKAFCYAFRSGK